MKKTEVYQVIQDYDLDDSLIIGYYGGGNFGDELLLEVLQNLLKQKGVKKLSIPFQNPKQFKQFHKDLGFEVFDIRDKKGLFKRSLKRKNIIIGGGGLWGVDMNLNTFIMSVYLFICRYFLRKKIYILGVGYYNSTNRMGHIGAWFAAKAAKIIVGRDKETYQNFSKYGANVFIDNDIAWYIDKVDSKGYAEDVKEIGEKLKISRDTLFITLRRSQSKHQNDAFQNFTAQVEAVIKANPKRPIIVGLLESKTKSPEEFAIARRWKKTYSNVQLMDFSVNPVALYMFFKKHAKNLTLVGPQFHIIIIAYLNGIRFMPIVYDNKVTALLEKVGINKKDHISIDQTDASRINDFIHLSKQKG